MKLDFFARRVHYVDHLAPVWAEMSEGRGSFYVPESIIGHAWMRGVEAIPLKTRSHDAMDVAPPASAALLVSAYGDAHRAWQTDSKRKLVMMEHGVGLTFSGHPGYAGGRGTRAKVKLFLAPNEYIRAKTEKALPNAKQVVIGTPKMDPWWTPEFDAITPLFRGGEKPVVCISFHWNGEKVSPEAGNAFAHYKNILPALAQNRCFKLIGHGHPRAMDYFAKFYEEIGVEVVRDFDEVMERAHVYVNDCSSTLYEFCVTGKPVVILNAPWFRRSVHHGIRFWEYADIGPQVDNPKTLEDVIKWMLWWPAAFAEKRKKMVRELYPFLGCSAKRAAGAIQEWLIENGQ